MILNSLEFKALCQQKLGNIKSAIETFKKELHYSQAFNRHKFTLKALRGLGNAYQNISEPDTALYYILKGLELVNIYKDSTMHGMLLNNAGLISTTNNKYKEAINYFFEGLKIMISLKDNSSIASIYSNIGVVYFKEGLLDSSMHYNKLSLDIGLISGNKSLIANSYDNIANIYFQQGKIKECIEYQIMSLNIRREIKETLGIANVCSNLGNSYLLIEDFVHSEKYYTESISLFSQIGNKNGMGRSLNGLGDVYEAQLKYPEAETKYNSALNIFENTNNTISIAETYVKLGNLQSKLKNYNPAIDLILSAIKIFRDININVALSDALVYLSDLYVNINELTLARISINEALNISTELCLPFIKSKCFLILETISEKEYNYSDALYYNKQYYKLNDSITNIEKTIEISKLVILYEAEQKEKENELLRLKNQQQLNKYSILSKESLITRLSLENETNQRILMVSLTKQQHDSISHLQEQKYIQEQFTLQEKELHLREKQISENKIKSQIALRNYIIFAVIAIILLFLSVMSNLRNSKNREKIELSNQIHEIKQEALNAQISDHFIGNTMTSINNFIESDDNKKASEYLIKFSRLIREVLHASREKLIPLSRDLDILTKYIELEKLQFKGAGLNFNLYVDDSLNLNETMVPPMIFQILAENSIEHGFNKSSGGLIQVKIKKENNNINCTVEDNGSGLNPIDFERNHNDGKRESIGGSLVKRIVMLNNPSDAKNIFNIINLNKTSSLNKGTRVEFTLPIVS